MSNFEKVVSGHYLEGLCVDETSVWVADPIAGGTRRIGFDGRVDTFLPEKKWVGSLLRGQENLLLLSGREIEWFDIDTGQRGSLDDGSFGPSIPGINEMVADAHGAIYFGGIDATALMEATAPRSVSLYRRDPDGRIVELVSGLGFTNGVALSPDGGTLYHNQTFAGCFAYEIRADGTLGNGRQLLEKQDCDGLAVDAEGALWIAGFETPELIRLRPDGGEVTRIPLPAGGATNVRLGGPDMRDLWVTCLEKGTARRLIDGIWPGPDQGTLYHVRADVPGTPAFRANIDLPVNAHT